MEIRALEIQAEIESFHWWFAGRRKILVSMIRKVLGGRDRLDILDIGCGTGGTIQALSEFGKPIGVDSSFFALKFCHNQKIKLLCQATATLLPFKDKSFDLVIALDILEHLDRDIDGLREFWRVLKDDGNIILFVPAFRFLWGIQDEVGHHKRRYVLSELREKIGNTGFSIIKISYFNFFLFPAIWMMRKAIRLAKIKVKSENIINTKSINWLLKRIFYLEALLLRWINFPFGISILCVGEKKVKIEF